MLLLPGREVESSLLVGIKYNRRCGCCGMHVDAAPRGPVEGARALLLQLQAALLAATLDVHRHLEVAGIGPK